MILTLLWSLNGNYSHFKKPPIGFHHLLFTSWWPMKRKYDNKSSYIKLGFKVCEFLFNKRHPFQPTSSFLPKCIKECERFIRRCYWRHLFRIIEQHDEVTRGDKSFHNLKLKVKEMIIQKGGFIVVQYIFININIVMMHLCINLNLLGFDVE